MPERGERKHALAWLAGTADGAQILPIQTGKQGHADQQRPAGQAIEPCARGLDHPRPARDMQVHHPDPEIRRRSASTRDRVGDIVKFQIEKDLEPANLQHLHERRPAARKQLLADLDPTACRIETLDQGKGLGLGREIERHDNAFGLRHVRSSCA